MASPYRYNGEGLRHRFLTGLAVPGSPTCSRVVGTVAVRAAPDTALCARWAEVVLIPAPESCQVRLRTFDRELSEWPLGDTGYARSGSLVHVYQLFR
jgi:hypothetical protein